MSMHNLENNYRSERLRRVAEKQKWGFQPSAVAYLEQAFGFTDATRKKAEKWCKENCDGRILVRGSDFYFETTEDAMHFWLIFSESR
jgi:hypothetical protein